MLADQAGVCAICAKPPGGKLPLNVDHDHKSGLVRGLLCWKCNHRLLGGSGDDPVLFRAAAEYLERPPSLRTIGQVIAPPKPKRKRRRKTITKKKENT